MRQLAFEAMQSINIGTREKHVAPHVLHHTPGEKTVSTTTTTPTRVQNDMGIGNVSRHPKFKTNRLQQVIGYKRTKRGLLDVGGTLLSAVFGVSTESELRDARKELQGEIKEVAHISEVIQIQAHKAEARMSDALSHIKSATESLLSVRLRENRLESFVQCSIILEHLEAVTLHLYDLMNETSTQKTLLQRGIVTQILTADQLKEIILKGLDIFRSYSFPLNLNDLNNRNISQFLSLLHSETSERQGYFHIFVPFIDNNRRYSLMKITPFPFIANTKKQSKNKTVLVAGVDLPKYIAMGKEDHVEIHSLEKCTPTVNASRVLCAQTRSAFRQPGTSGLAEGEVYVSGTSEGGAYATFNPTRAPSPHYKTITRVLPVTPPPKPKRAVKLVLPPVRYTGEDAVYAPSSERGLLDDEGYIIPSSSYPGSI